jgi:hypothetical protein
VVFLVAVAKKYKKAWASIEAERELFESSGGIVRDEKTRVTFQYPGRNEYSRSIKKPTLRDKELRAQGLLALFGFIFVIGFVSIFGGGDTTIGNTIAALDELTRPGGRGYKRAVRRMSDDTSGVDDTTLATLQPLAKAVLAAKPEATESLSRAARERAAELQNHERVLPRTESLSMPISMRTRSV